MSDTPINTGIPAVDALGGFVNNLNYNPGATGVTGTVGAIDPNAPKAIPQVTTGADGLPHVVYVDAQTGHVVTNLSGYNIISANGTVITPATAPIPVANPSTPATGGTVQDPHSSGGGAMNAGPSGSGNRGSTNPMNNYGYQSKPGLVSALGALPGGLGLAGKAVNAGWNANNQAAVNTARQMLGLPSASVGQNVKSILSDNKGQVSNNSTINGKQYSIGFEAMSPTGATNLTPMEANERANLLGGIKETPGAKAVTPSGVAPHQSLFSRVTGIPSGIIGGGLASLGLGKGFATRALNSIFGLGQTPTPSATPTPLGVPPAATSVGNLAAETAPAAVGNPNSAPAVSSPIDHPDTSPDRNASNNFGYQSTPDNNTGTQNSATAYAGDNMAGTAQTGAPAGTTGPASPAGAATNLGSSPAARAAMGMVSRTPEERAAMEKAIAGELSPHTLAALAAPDQTTPDAVAAQKEFGSIVATMENRAVSKQYVGMIDAVSQPSQYNSMMAKNMPTTVANVAKYKPALDQALNNFYTGKIAIPNYNVTSYYNPAISNPAWGVNGVNPSKRMTQAQQVGYHMFGVLPEYAPDPYAEEAAKAFETMSGTSYQPGKMADDTPSAFSGGGTGTTFGGSPGRSGGAGYTPGGMNSPSGSSYGDGTGGGNSSNSGLGSGYSSSSASASGYGGSYGGQGGNSYGGGFGGSSGGGYSGTGGLGGQSAGGGYSPGGMNSPSGSSYGGGYSPGAGPGGGYSPGGLGSPSGSSADSGAGGGMNGSGSSAGAQSRSDGWN